MRMRRGEGRARVSESPCGARGGADAVVQVGRHEAWDGVWTPWRDVFSVARGLYELISMCELRRAGFSLLSRPAPSAPLLLLPPSHDLCFSSYRRAYAVCLRLDATG